MSNCDASRTLDYSQAYRSHGLVPEIADRFLADNPDFSAELRLAIRSAANESTTTKEFWKKVEAAMDDCK